MGNFVEYAVRGLPVGCVFALLALGLVLNYKTSGVFNLAFGAQAYTSAAVFYVLRKDHEWPLLPAAFVAVVVVGALLGILLERGLYRHLRTATPLAKLITSLGLLIAIPEITKLVFGFGDKPQYNPPPLWPTKRTDDFLWPQGSRIVLDAGQISTIVATALVCAGLWVLFNRSSLGLRMRAVVESPRLVELQGIDADRVSLASWILSSMLAGLAGVLIAPLFAALVAQDFITLLVAALACTVFGNLTNLPKTVLGGLLLGILQQELTGFLPPNSDLTTAVRPALPFVVLIGLVVGRLIVARIRKRPATFDKDISDPMSGVDPPPPVPVAATRPPWLATATRVFGVAVIAGGLYICWNVLDAAWLGLVVSGACVAVIMLSMVMMTGIGGTVSLCQATFAAIGAFTTAQLVLRYDMSVLVAMLVGAAVAAVIGAIVALPVIRLPAVYAALTTLAFALFFEKTVRPLKAISGGPNPVTVPRPLIGSIDFADNRNFLVLVMVVLAVLGGAVILVRRGTTGRFLDALRGSETAAASIGIGPGRSRLVAFTLAAGIAGFGGGLLASFNGQANYESSYVFIYGLIWLVMVVTAGSRSVQAAITSGITFFVFPKLLEMLFTFPSNWLVSHPDARGIVRTLAEFPNPSWAQGVAFILFGLGALTYAKHPEGIIEFQTTASTLWITKRLRRGPAPDAEPPVADVATGGEADAPTPA